MGGAQGGMGEGEERRGAMRVLVACEFSGKPRMTDADLHREEWIAERAGILEFEAGYTREQAEVMARSYWTQREAEQ